MGRIISIVLIVVVIGFMLAFVTAHQEIFAVAIPAQSAAVLEAVETIPVDFSETGTLVFYPNNIGPVPYLFYQDFEGRTIARALTFSNASPTNFSSWSGAHISVTGRLNSEHVVVSNITYLSGP